MRWRMNVSAAATVVKNVASFGAFALRCAAGKRAIMLDEASIISAMRRPGYETSSFVSDEYGSAKASTKNGRPARNRSSAPWRTIDVHDPPLQSGTAVLGDRDRAESLRQRLEHRRALRVRVAPRDLVRDGLRRHGAGHGDVFSLRPTRPQHELSAVTEGRRLGSNDLRLVTDDLRLVTDD